MLAMTAIFSRAKKCILAWAHKSSGIKYIINPYDEYAIEEALQIKEKAGGGEVIIASFALK